MANDLEELLHLIKEFGPSFQVTKGDLQNPTSNFVVKFYTKFVTEFQDKIQFLAGSCYYLPEMDDNLETEDRLFQTIYQILYSFEKVLIFKYSDIYCPTSTRTKNFIQLCCHLLAYAENMLDDIDAIGNKVFTVKADMSNLKKEHEDMLSAIQQHATKKSELLETKDKLQKELGQVKTFNKEKKEFAIQKEKVFSKKIKEINTLTQLFQKEEHDLYTLEREEKDLSEQCVTEAEYKNLLKLRDNLEKEQTSLDSDEIDLGEFLHQEHNEVLHYQECINIVPEIEDLNLEIIKGVIEFETEVRDFQIKIEKLSNNRINPLKLLQLQNENKLISTNEHLEKLSGEYEAMKKKYIDYREDCISKINRLKEDMANVADCNNKLITNSQQAILELETNMKNLKAVFITEYIKVAKADAAAKEYFKDIIHKINDFS